MKTISAEFDVSEFARVICRYLKDDLVCVTDGRNILKVATIDGAPVHDIEFRTEASSCFIGAVGQNAVVAVQPCDDLFVCSRTDRDSSLYKYTMLDTMGGSSSSFVDCTIVDNDIWYINKNLIVVRATVEGTEVHKTEVLDAMKYAEIMSREIGGEFRQIEKLDVLGSNLLITYWPAVNAIDPSGTNCMRMDYVTAVINYETGEVLRILPGKRCIYNATGDRALIHEQEEVYYDVLTGKQYLMPKFHNVNILPLLCYIGDEIVYLGDTSRQEMSEWAALHLGRGKTIQVKGLLLIGPFAQPSKSGFHIQCPLENLICEDSENVIYCDFGKMAIMHIGPVSPECHKRIAISGLIIESIDDLEMLAEEEPYDR